MTPVASSDPLPHPVGFTVAGCSADGSQARLSFYLDDT